MALVVSLLIAGPAAAQPATVPADPLGPVRCYLAATRGSNLTQVQARQLCVGAIDESAAWCFAQVTDQGFADAQGIQLCAGATSLAPATCTAHLQTATGLDDASIVAYCAALPWPLVPLAGQSAPACVVAAHLHTWLPDANTVELCSGSTSDHPVACYVWGQTQTQLADQDLLDLCRPVGLYPYAP
ncbi:MAG TPA: hypothetical protein VHW23_03915 [Kofleriaceae bacterium]|nr:hypothetical protein [Kofleriaceae bacterium]